MITINKDTWSLKIKDIFSKKKAQIKTFIKSHNSLQIRKFSFNGALNNKLTADIRIAHLTDQHVGKITPFEIQLSAIKKTNEENIDLVLLSGDFVCHNNLFLSDLTYLISQFNAPVFAVLGNHDHWTNAQKVKQALKKAGAETLSNANTSIEIKHQRIQLIGLDDAYTHNDNIKKAVLGMNKNLPSIGLSHIGEQADKLWQNNIPLVLSGHTHAGQITIARINELFIGQIAGYKYIHGLYSKEYSKPEKGSVYVSAGIGAAIIPIRIGKNSKREVTIFNLKAPKTS